MNLKVLKSFMLIALKSNAQDLLKNTRQYPLRRSFLSVPKTSRVLETNCQGSLGFAIVLMVPLEPLLV